MLIKQTKAAGAVNKKFCEFDGGDGEGGVYLNLKECLPVCDYLDHCNLYLYSYLVVFVHQCTSILVYLFHSVLVYEYVSMFVC